jgi:hypothetical protein
MDSAIDAPPTPPAGDSGTPGPPPKKSTTYRVYEALAFVAIVFAGTIYRFQFFLESVENLRLVFLLAASVLLFLSLLKVEDARRVSLLSITDTALLNLLLCILFGIILSQGEKPETTLVYILGFAALIIGAQHLVEFHGAEKTLKKLNAELGRTSTTLMEQLQSSENKIRELNEEIANQVGHQVLTLRYDAYRQLVTEAYQKARKRILGSGNHWPIDPQFWHPSKRSLTLEEDEFWENQKVYQHLFKALHESSAGRISPELRIIFAGRLDVLPTSGMSTALSTSDFLLFLGVLWRLALARRLRKAFPLPDRDGASDEQLVRVFIADMPISAHVIDNDVFLLRSAPGMKHTSSLGLKIGDGNNITSKYRDSDVEIAETFAEMIDRYIRKYVRSAKEYAASLLVFAALFYEKTDDLILVEDGIPNRAIIRTLLERLGMSAWAEEYSGDEDTFLVDATYLSDRATDLAVYFLQHYYAERKLTKLPSREHYWNEADNLNRVTIDRLIEDMI